MSKYKVVYSLSLILSDILTNVDAVNEIFPIEFRLGSKVTYDKLLS